MCRNKLPSPPCCTSVSDSAAVQATHHIPTERTTAIKRAIKISCHLQTALSRTFPQVPIDGAARGVGSSLGHPGSTMLGPTHLLLPSPRSAPSFPDLRHPRFLPPPSRWSRTDHAVDGMVSVEGLASCSPRPTGRSGPGSVH